MAYQRFDHTQKGSGLASEGYSLNKPDEVYAYYQRMQSNPHSDDEKNFVKKVQQYAKNNKGSWTDKNYVTQAVDWAFRDYQRNNQKAPRMFGALDGILKPALTIGASIINPGLGAVVGGGLGAANGGGLMGGLLGAAGGYTGGATLKGIGSALSGAGGLSTFLNAPGTFVSNLGRGALTSLQNILPGYGGNVAGILNSAPASITSSLGTAASVGKGLAPIVNGSASVPSFTPPTTLQATGDLVRNLLSPGNVVGNVANNLVTNAATSLVTGALTPETTGAMQPMQAPQANTFGVRPQWENPYLPMMPNKRKGIRNELVPIPNATPGAMPSLIPNATRGSNPWEYL